MEVLVRLKVLGAEIVKEQEEESLPVPDPVEKLPEVKEKTYSKKRKKIRGRPRISSYTEEQMSSVLNKEKSDKEFAEEFGVDSPHTITKYRMLWKKKYPELVQTKKFKKNPLKPTIVPMPID